MKPKPKPNPKPNPNPNPNPNRPDPNPDKVFHVGAAERFGAAAAARLLAFGRHVE